jgi:hypothetical protein
MHTVGGVFILEVGDMRNSGIRPRPPFSSETCLCADLPLASRLQKLKGCQGEKYELGGGGEGGKAARRLYVEDDNDNNRFEPLLTLFDKPQSRTRTYDLKHLTGRTSKRNKWDPSDTYPHSHLHPVLTAPL